jgi:hypothetical protein
LLEVVVSEFCVCFAHAQRDGEHAMMVLFRRPAILDTCNALAKVIFVISIMAAKLIVRNRFGVLKFVRNVGLGMAAPRNHAECGVSVNRVAQLPQLSRVCVA